MVTGNGREDQRFRCVREMIGVDFGAVTSFVPWRDRNGTITTYCHDNAPTAEEPGMDQPVEIVLTEFSAGTIRCGSTLPVVQARVTVGRSRRVSPFAKPTTIPIECC
jgi:hypothetical protein